MSTDSKKSIIEAVTDNRKVLVLIILVLEAVLIGITKVENEKIALVGLIGSLVLLGIVVILFAYILIFKPNALDIKKNYIISFKFKDQIGTGNINLDTEASKLVVRDNNNNVKYDGNMILTNPFGPWMVSLSNKDSKCSVIQSDTIYITLVEKLEKPGETASWESTPFSLNHLTKEVSRK